MNLEQDFVFISGIDSTISEIDIQSAIKFSISKESSILIHQIDFYGPKRFLAEVRLHSEDALLLLEKYPILKIKNCQTKVFNKNCMKTIIISKLPEIVSEKDLFLILLRLTPGITKIELPENSETHRTYGIALVKYNDFELARAALEIFKYNPNIYERKVSFCWKDPFQDFSFEISLETNAIYLKNISIGIFIEDLKSLMEKYGKITRIKKYATKAYIEYAKREDALNAIENLDDITLLGSIWKIYPAKKFDIVKYRESIDKNITFSKNFLEDYDQQKLSKFAYDGIVDDSHTNFITKAKNILENARNARLNEITALKMQYTSLKNACQGGQAEKLTLTQEELAAYGATAAANLYYGNYYAYNIPGGKN